MAQIWDTETSTWKHRNQARAMFMQKVLEYKGEFLEIGPGYGRVMVEVQKQASITGLEMDLELIEKLSSRNLKVVQGIAEKMPFADASFDVVISEEVLEHIKNQKQVIKEIYRVLKPGGIVILTTPNKWIYRTLMFVNNIVKWNFQAPIYKNPTPGHVAEITGVKLKRLFKQQFELIEFVPMNSYLSQRFLNKFSCLAINNMIVCKKK